MADYQYLIIGGGMTADAAVKGIREVDTTGTIGIIAAEPHRPYSRPPLSKALWKGEPVDNIWRNTPKEHVEIHFERTATGIDTKKKAVLDNHGTSYTYNKLLLATGGSVRRLPYKVDGIIYFRTLDDYQQLRSLAAKVQRFVIIGGGFIGSEIAAALALNKKTVTMIFPEEGIGSRVYPPGLSQYLNGLYQSKGIEVLTKNAVEKIDKDGPVYRVRTTSGRELHADAVVAGIGITPNVDLAKAAGLSVDNGITVDEFLKTSNPDIYAAGDVANFYNPSLGKRIRVEHEDNANTMGHTAGANMAGGAVPYHHLPFFYSDLFELGYEAVGELDAFMDIVEEWKEKYREGVIYYLMDGRVRGVLLWNTWGQVDAARKLIAEKGPFDPKNLKTRLPV